MPTEGVRLGGYRVGRLEGQRVRGKDASGAAWGYRRGGAQHIYGHMSISISIYVYIYIYIYIIHTPSSSWPTTAMCVCERERERQREGVCYRWGGLQHAHRCRVCVCV